MAMQAVTQKSQISKWYTKRIKDFTNLTENEALFEYEALKLRERQRKYAKKAGIKGYKAPQIPRPTVTISRDVEYLRSIPTSEVKTSATTGFDQLVGPSAPIYNYELEQWKEEKFPDYEPRYDYSWQDDWNTTYGYSEPDYTPPLEPYPEEPSAKLDDTLDDYLIDPTTGEAIPKSDISSLEERGREFLERLVNYTEAIRDETIISHSAYPNGRTRNARSRAWMEQNVEKATNKVLDRLNAILGDEEEVTKFAERCMHGDYLQTLQNSIGAFVTAAYKSPVTDGNNWGELDNLLNDIPLSLEDLSYMDDFDDSWFEDDGY